MASLHPSSPPSARSALLASLIVVGLAARTQAAPQAPQASSTPTGLAPTASAPTVGTTYCDQSSSVPPSIPNCFAKISVDNPTLATGVWSMSPIPRSPVSGPGTTFAIYIYKKGPGIGQSTFSAQVPFGTLCLANFKRSSEGCGTISVFGLGATCNAVTISLPVNCSSGGLGIQVGDDVNVQGWYRDKWPESSNGHFSDALYYTLL